jgi:hypothetical protein
MKKLFLPDVPGGRAFLMSKNVLAAFALMAPNLTDVTMR